MKTMIGLALVTGIVLGSLVAIANADIIARYTLTAEDCNPGGLRQCPNCVTTTLTPGGCPGGTECVAQKCTGGGAVFSGCTSGVNGNGNCQMSMLPAGVGCTGCKTYSDTPASCIAQQTCTSPGCGGVGVAAPTPKVPTCF